MGRWRISLLELMMLTALVGILAAWSLHLQQQIRSVEEFVTIEISPDHTLLARSSNLGTAVYDLGSETLVARFPAVAESLAQPF